MALLRARESIMGFFRPELNQLGLTEQQWRIMRVLYEYQDLEFHELARLACILPPSLTGMLTRLERKGLLRRRKATIDQRRLHLSLTREGTARFEGMSRRMEELYHVIETQFGRQRLAQLFSLLLKVQELRVPTVSNSADVRRIHSR
jgi:homoprotocatechuate degradation regulator HpaR